MPNVIIEGPKLPDLDLKREMVRKITDILENAYKVPREHIVITIKAFPPEDVSVGGNLLIDR